MRNLGTVVGILFLLAVTFSSKASHLVGGEMTYRCLGNNNYEVTVIIYRDCFAGRIGLDPNIPTTIFDSNGQIVLNTGIPLLYKTSLPINAPNSCTTFPSNICTEKGVYIDTFNLPPRQGGYTITHQRCCRNSTISNVPAPADDWGNTYTITIPSMDVSCNNSPRFKSEPPVVLCLNQPIKLDLGATDADGDSLFYELCAPLHGGSRMGGATVNPAAAPPYVQVPYKNGFTVNSPITANPTVSLNPQTGLLTGRPSAAGQFVFAICVSEYRNGQLLSTNRRDFQFNVSNSCKVTLAIIADQNADASNLCSGGKIDFKNRSQHASSFFWDFGDTTVTSDTSRAKHPSYTYKDTGRYQVMLIADPGSKCADTTYALFRVFDSIQVDFDITGDGCLESNAFNFLAKGNYSPDASFAWNFETTTNVGKGSTDENPQNVVFPGPGEYDIRLVVIDKGCGSRVTKTIRVYPNPEIGEAVAPVKQCLPYTAKFEDQTEAYGPVQHYWFFGDGSTSNLPSPTHTYTEPGVYTVRHAIKTIEGCIDSGYSVYNKVIELFPLPYSAMEVHPKEQSIYSPVFDISSYSEGATYTETFLPDGRKLVDMADERLVMQDTGTYVFQQISYNQYGCTDTLYDTIRVTTPFNLHIPSAFTPNGDGINDEFFYTATDARNAILHIYNRWGELVYKSNNMYARWNGRKMNEGEVLPGEVYTYILILSVKEGGYTHREQGTVTLIR